GILNTRMNEWKPRIVNAVFHETMRKLLQQNNQQVLLPEKKIETDLREYIAQREDILSSSTKKALGDVLAEIGPSILQPIREREAWKSVITMQNANTSVFTKEDRAETIERIQRLDNQMTTFLKKMTQSKKKADLETLQSSSLKHWEEFWTEYAGKPDSISKAKDRKSVV